MDDGDLISTNERAERLMGRRLAPEDEARGVLALDLPCELGFWCPVHQQTWDEGLAWSEYRGFLWCSACNVDYPTALCVPLDAKPDPERPWMNAGVADAVRVFLDTVEDAVKRAAA